MTEKNIGTQREFAKLMGVTDVQAHNWARDGKLVLENGNKKRVIFDQSKAKIAETEDLSKINVKARHARERAEKLGNSEQPESPPTAQVEQIEGKASSVYQTSKAKREKFNAALVEIEYKKAIGELLYVNDVILTLSRVATDLRSQLETLPDRFATQFAAESDPAKIRLQAAETIEHLLAGLEKHFKKLSES
jgi:phage terminase Nu1 subunit (DNA packaging protein)